MTKALALLSLVQTLTPAFASRPETTWSVMHPTELDPVYMARVAAKAVEYGGVDSFEVCGTCHSGMGGMDGLLLMEPYPTAARRRDVSAVQKNRAALKGCVAEAHKVGKKGAGHPGVVSVALVNTRHRFMDPEVPVAVYYDSASPIESGAKCRAAVVLIHGWGGHVRKLLPAFNKALASRAGTPDNTPYVIAPLFPRRSTLRADSDVEYDGRAVWNDSWEGKPLDEIGSAADDWRGGGDADGTRFSSFDYVDRIFARLGDRRLFPNLTRVVLAGFSAGGQFVGRYAAVGRGVVRDGVEVVYMDMAPSTEFRFDRDQPWHYGLKGRPRYSASLTEGDIMRNLCSRRVWRGCGAEDTLGRPHTALDMTPPAVLQGQNRLERFRGFEKYLEAYPEWKRQCSFHVFENIGHNEVLAYPTKQVLDFVFGNGDRVSSK